MDGEVLQRSWLYSSTPASCRPCKCVKVYAVTKASGLREDVIDGGKGRKRKGGGGSRRKMKGGRREEDGGGSERGRVEVGGV